MPCASIRARARLMRSRKSAMCAHALGVPGLIGWQGFGELGGTRASFVLLAELSGDPPRKIGERHVVPAGEGSLRESPAVGLADVAVRVAECGDEELSAEVHLGVSGDPPVCCVWAIESDHVRVGIVE